jgi:hypothetical protein
MRIITSGSAALAAHEAALDPHTAYLREVEVATSSGADKVVRANGLGKVASDWLTAALSSIAALTPSDGHYPLYTGASTAVLARAVDYTQNIGKPTAAGHLFRHGLTATVSGTNSFNAGRIWYVRWPVYKRTPINAFGGLTTTSPGSGTASYALYTMGNDGCPGSLIADLGDVNMAASGDKGVTLGAPMTLEPGEYCAAMWSSVAATWHGHVAATVIPFFRTGADRSTTATVWCLYETLAWSGTFPANAAAYASLTEVTTAAPMLWWA